MDTSKIIKGVVNSGRYTVTAPIVKENYGIYLQIEGAELPETYQVDFSNEEHHGTSVTMIGNADGVRIPRQFIDTGKDIFAFLYHVGENFGRTVYKFRIPNKVRPDRTEEQPTPEEQSAIDQAISALNEAVAQTAQDVIDADASAQNASADADRAESARDTAQGYANNAQTSANNASASAQASANSATASAQSASDAETARQAATSLVAEAQGYADASEQSASASANSASQAHGYAQSASASAQSASGYASNAQVSANTASTKASEASTSAQTASNKASEATQSATNASQSAQTAESAKTSAQTAQGLAESARDSAINAQEDAESARDEAQTLVDGISGKVEQIDSNTERIESLEDDRFKPYAVDTASGAVASFSDGADDIPLKSLVVDINPVQDTSSGDPSPENICPISGWTGANIQRNGTNFFDGEMENGDINANTGESSGTSSSRYRSKNYIPIRAGSYYFKSPNRTTVRVFFYDKDKNFLWFTSWNANAVNTFTSEKIRYMRFRFPTGKIDGDEQISINSSSSVTDYVPYVGTTLPISWETEAGTVYGGKLDVLSGKLTVEMASIQIKDTSWTTQSTNAFKTNLDKKLGMLIPMSDAYKSANPVASLDNLPNNSITIHRYAYGENYRKIVYIKDTRYTTVEEFAEAMGEHQIVYALNTPIEIQLTPTEVRSLLGANNIFADTGDCAVEYRADTKLYIEKLTQPEEDDMIADANIVSGQYFMVGNTLYKATANIANGGAIVVGTNCTRVSLAQALNEINV